MFPCRKAENESIAKAVSNLKVNAATRNNYFGGSMKSLKHLKDKVTDYENLYRAYLNARKNKRYRGEVLKFSANLEDNLVKIQEELINQTYKPGNYREFYVYEPKQRLVMAQPFKDRVVQWALYQILNPHFVKGYIKDSYACIEGRGSISGTQRVFYWTSQVSRRANKYYYLKLDVSKFFYRIDHEVACSLVDKQVNYDPWGMWIIRLFVESDTTCFGLPPGMKPEEVTKEDRLSDKGVAVGNLSSQMLANVYMNVIDQYCKRELGIHFYARYMDDIIILSDSKQQLHEWKQLIEKKLNTALLLELNDKTCIRPITLGIEFCGYKIFPTHIKLRKSTALRMKRRLKEIKRLYAEGEIDLERASQTVNSYMGILSHCDSYYLRRTIFGEYSENSQVDGWFYLQRENKEPETQPEELRN